MVTNCGLRIADCGLIPAIRNPQSQIRNLKTCLLTLLSDLGVAKVQPISSIQVLAEVDEDL